MTARSTILAISVVMSVLISAPGANACEAYKALETAELKEYRDKLTESGADPLDRLFAFEELVCSDRPTVRAYAIREGLKNASDDLVRHQIMLEALMQKSRIDIELVNSGNITKSDKEYISSVAGVYSRNISFRDRERGCLGLNFDDCDPRYSILIVGGKIEYNMNSATGTFELTEQNELVGYFRPGSSPKYSKIPAIIRLF